MWGGGDFDTFPQLSYKVQLALAIAIFMCHLRFDWRVIPEYLQ